MDLNVNRDLLEAAREAGVNLSAILEEALAEKLADAKRELWVRENSDAIADCNDLVEEHGEFKEDEFHHTTFQRFLKSLGSDVGALDTIRVWPPIRSFNAVLTTSCVFDEIEVGLG